jgi:hypothetical protein
MEVASGGEMLHLYVKWLAEGGTRTFKGGLSEVAPQ